MRLIYNPTMRLRHVLPMAALLLTMAACRTARPIVSDNAPTLPDQPAAEATDAATQPRELEVMTFTAVVEGTTVSGQLRMASDSIIWVSVNKIIELGRAMATVDSVWVNVPIAGKYFAGNYTDVERYSKQPVSFGALQQMARSDNAEQMIETLARQMGLDAKVRITRRQKVQRLTFPFTKH